MNMSSRASRRPRVPSQAAPRLEVEHLEERWVPSTVLNLNDSGPGSLRQAILDANSNSANDLIKFAPGLSGTINLESQLPDLTSNIDIEGPGPANLTVQPSSGKVFRIVQMEYGGPAVTIAGLTITHSDGIYAGGGGSLTVRNCNIVDNPGDGIGSFISEALTVSDCTFAHNAGTAISNSGSGIGPGAAGTIKNSVFINNGGGAIENGYWISIDPGVIHPPEQGGRMTISYCVINGNTSGIGGIGNDGALTILNSAITDNTSTGFVPNRGGEGGGIWNDGVVTIDNSTVAFNVAKSATYKEPLSLIPTSKYLPGAGGGIWNSGTLTMTSCTIAHNTAFGGNGGGLAVGGGTVTLRNTIVAQNVLQPEGQSPVGPDVAGTVVSQGHNLIGDSTGASGLVATELVGTSAHPIDARLGPLQNNGGPTETMALLAGSPAIGAGDSTNAAQWDQRGPGFPRIVNGRMDIGAFEVQQGAASPDSLVGCDSANGQWWISRSTGSSFKTTVADVWNPNVTWVNVQTGNFSGNGTSDLIGMVQQTGQWFVAVPDSQGHFTTRIWDVWSPNCTWTMHVGDVNGDGKDDIVGYAQQTGQWFVGISTGTAFTTSLWDAWNPNVLWTNVMVGDVTGDGKADILACAQNTRQWWVGMSNGSAFHPSLWDVWNPNVTWVNVQLGDFNGDGRIDLVGRAQQSGQWWVGLSTGTSFKTSLWDAWSTGATWVDVMVGDFNGDGKADIVGRALESGQWYCGLSTGSAFQTSLWDAWSTGVTWVDVQVGDFNGDGRTDIAGMAKETGQWFVGVSLGQVADFNSELPGHTEISLPYSGSFKTSLWDAWNPGVAWRNVQTLKLR
jgi:Right handed beta helix region/FG-GAP-like repeat